MSQKVKVKSEMIPKVSVPSDFLRLPPASEINNPVVQQRYSTPRFTVKLKREQEIGLGFTLAHTREGEIIISKIEKFGPAYSAGLQAYDIIEAINGNNLGNNMLNVRGVVNLIRSCCFEYGHVELQIERRSLYSNTNSNYPASYRRRNIVIKNNNNNDNGSIKVHPFMQLLAKKNLSSDREAMEWSPKIDYHFPFVQKQVVLCCRVLNSFRDGDDIAYTVWVLDVENQCEFYAPVRYYRDFEEFRAAASSLIPVIGKIPLQLSENNNVFGKIRWSRIMAAHPHQPRRRKSRSNSTSENTDDASSSIMAVNSDTLSFQELTDQRARSKGLEQFLRKVCTLMLGFDNSRSATTDENNFLLADSGIHSTQEAAEVSIHLRSFLGCDDHKFLSASSNSFRFGYQENTLRDRLRLSAQLYTCQLFHLPPLERIVDDFIEASKKRIENVFVTFEAGRKSTAWLMSEAQVELEKIRDCLDQLQSLILEGCANDFKLIASRFDIDRNVAETVFSDGCREQVEVEVYVPLRSFLSRLLVNAYRHQDAEMNFKMRELRKKQQSFFNIKPCHQSKSNWQSAVSIMEDGVGKSTLPCQKLRAILDGAKEIMVLYEEEHHQQLNMSQQPQDGMCCSSYDDINEVVDNADAIDDVFIGDDSISTTNKLMPSCKSSMKRSLSTSLSADDFLPIFIFCLARAKLERPCALSALLQTLCEPRKRIGETGYYLATFEAAISFIHNLNLVDGSVVMARDLL